MKFKRIIVPLALAVLTLPLMVGCKPVTSTTPPAALAPGAVNIFDQDSFKTLSAIEATIDSLKTSIAADPNLNVLKTAVNQASQDYDLAYLACSTYHSAATAANQQAATAALTKVQSDVTSIQKAVK